MSGNGQEADYKLLPGGPSTEAKPFDEPTVRSTVWLSYNFLVTNFYMIHIHHFRLEFLRTCAGRNVGFFFSFGSHFLPCRSSRFTFPRHSIFESPYNSYYHAKLNAFALKQTNTPTCSVAYWVVNLLQVRKQI